MSNIELIKPLVKKILERASDYEWELKGLGLIRTYLTEDSKLHVWDNELKVPNVSMIHEHPWSFESLIVAGQLQQVRYKRFETCDKIETMFAHPYLGSTVTCGPGGCLQTNPQPCYLAPQARECYHEGQSYVQTTSEIHYSMPEDGTVTLVKRLDYRLVREANVYWPQGEQWVSSEPRLATKEEINRAVEKSFHRWF